MGLEITDLTILYSMYIISLVVIGTFGSLVVHLIDVKTRPYSRYKLEGEGENHYRKRLAVMK